MERFPSGQREQTVNLSSDDFGGSNPPLSTIDFQPNAGVAQLARASAFQAEGRGFESRLPLHKTDIYVLSMHRFNLNLSLKGSSGIVSD